MSRTAISPRFATSTGPVICAPVLHQLIYRSYGSLWAMTLPTSGPATAGGRSGSPATGPAAGERVAESRRRHAEALEMGGPQAVDRHRASGRLPVRERITLLLDEDSWFETGALAQPERRLPQPRRLPAAGRGHRPDDRVRDPRPPGRAAGPDRGPGRAAEDPRPARRR